MTAMEKVARMPERQTRQVPVRGAGPIGSLRSEMNQLLDRFMGRGSSATAAMSARDPWNMDDFLLGRDPFGLMQDVWGGTGFGQTDLSETDSAWEIEIDLPGLSRDNVQVDCENGVLTVSAERRDEREDERKGYYLSERSYGQFRRSFRIPDGVDIDGIGAKFVDGVLTLTLPKTEEARRNTRRIEISDR